MPTVIPERAFWTLRSDRMLTRILAFGLLLAALLWGCGTLSQWLRVPGLPWQATLLQLVLLVLLRLLPFVGAYWLLARVVEARRIEELAARKLLPDACTGFIAGGLLMIVVAVLLWAAGGYRIDGTYPAMPWFRALLWLGVLPGVNEEIVSRGVLYRIIEERFGSWIALIVSALVFGFLHAWNPNATWWSCLAIAIEAGLLFGIVYTITRSLYVCMGLHAAWNFFEGPVLGIPVSGIDQQGLLSATMTGPAWLSGGAFGAEASVLTVALLGAVSGALMLYAYRRGLIRPPQRRADRIRMVATSGEGNLFGKPS